MSEPAAEPTFEAVAAELLRRVIDLISESADLRQPSYMLNDGHYARAAQVAELADLATALDCYLP